MRRDSLSAVVIVVTLICLLFLSTCQCCCHRWPADGQCVCVHYRHVDSLLLSLSAFQKASAVSIGRFQVAPSQDLPDVNYQEPRPLSNTTPTAHSPPPSEMNQSESSESSTEESSFSTVTTSPLKHPLGYYDNPRGQVATDRMGEVKKEERKRRGSRKLSISLWESSTSNQSLSRSPACISSDESESDKEDMWAELKELRER